MTFVIRDDIPIPTVTRTLRGSKYPLVHLEPGECFIVPKDQLPSKGASSLRAAVGQFKKASGSEAKFIIRTIQEDGSVGVWRVE